MKTHGNALAKNRGWTRETIEFMSQVFFELDFVTINDGLISLAVNANKHDLAESGTYQTKTRSFRLRKIYYILLFSN